MANKRDWPMIAFRVPEPQQRKFDKYVEQQDKSKQDILYDHFQDLVEDVELEDPRDELQEVRREKEELRDDLAELKEQMDDIRDSVDELNERERELEDKVEKHDTIGAQSLDEAVDGLRQQLIDGRKDRLGVGYSDVERVAADWAASEEEIVRRVWESDPRIGSKQVVAEPGDSYPRESWARDVGADIDDAVEKTVYWLETERARLARRRESSKPVVRDAVMVYEESLPSRAADAHDVDVEELVDDALDEFDDFGEEVEFDYE